MFLITPNVIFSGYAFLKKTPGFYFKPCVLRLLVCVLNLNKEKESGSVSPFVAEKSVWSGVLYTDRPRRECSEEAVWNVGILIIWLYSLTCDIHLVCCCCCCLKPSMWWFIIIWHSTLCDAVMPVHKVWRSMTFAKTHTQIHLNHLSEKTTASSWRYRYFWTCLAPYLTSI